MGCFNYAFLTRINHHILTLPYSQNFLTWFDFRFDSKELIFPIFIDYWVVCDRFCVIFKDCLNHCGPVASLLILNLELIMRSWIVKMTRQIVKKSFSFCPRLRRCDRQPYKGQVAWKMDEWHIHCSWSHNEVIVSFHSAQFKTKRCKDKDVFW